MDPVLKQYLTAALTANINLAAASQQAVCVTFLKITLIVKGDSSAAALASELELGLKLIEFSTELGMAMLGIFTAGEFRTFVVARLPSGRSLVEQMPESGSSIDQMAGAIRVLAHQGELQRNDFWSRCRTERPRRVGEINDLSSWSCNRLAYILAS